MPDHSRAASPDSWLVQATPPSGKSGKERSPSLCLHRNAGRSRGLEKRRQTKVGGALQAEEKAPKTIRGKQRLRRDEPTETGSARQEKGAGGEKKKKKKHKQQTAQR